MPICRAASSSHLISSLVGPTLGSEKASPVPLRRTNFWLIFKGLRAICSGHIVRCTKRQQYRLFEHQESTTRRGQPTKRAARNPKDGAKPIAVPDGNVCMWRFSEEGLPLDRDRCAFSSGP